MKDGNYINKVKISNLKPDKSYIYRIKSAEYKWEDNFAFKTKSIGEKIDYPHIKSGDSSIGAFVLIEKDEENRMLYTGIDKTWALDFDSDDYTVKEYAQFLPSMYLRDELQATILNIIQPVSARSGPNCMTNIKRNDDQYYPKPSGLTELMETRSSGQILIAGCIGHHTEECYDDTYCRSVEAGINPAITLTLWVHESAASMYAAEGTRPFWTHTEDFGIHKDSIKNNFSAQLDHLLSVQLDPSYISGYCTNKGLSDDQRWATKYACGYCERPAGSSLQPGQRCYEPTVTGKEYISQIKSYYSLLGGAGSLPSWPWKVTANQNACDRSSQTENQVFRECNGNRTGSNPVQEKTKLILKQNGDTKSVRILMDVPVYLYIRVILQRKI